jgi:hypothetical protein
MVMNHIDDAVTEVLSSAPPVPDLRALRRRTRIRFFRRATVTLGIVAVVVLSAISVDASLGTKGTHPPIVVSPPTSVPTTKIAPPTVVPSTHVATTVPTSKGPRVGIVPTTVRAPQTCTAAQLSFTLARDLGSTMQQPAAFFALTNRASQPCTVSGYPTLTLDDTAGRPIPVTIQPGDAYQLNDPGAHTIVLSANQTAYFGFGWVDVNPPDGNTNGCERPARARVRVPDTNDSLSTAAQLSNVVCPPNASVTAIALRSAFTIGRP